MLAKLPSNTIMLAAFLKRCPSKGGPSVLQQTRHARGIVSLDHASVDGDTVAFLQKNDIPVDEIGGKYVGLFAIVQNETVLRYELLQGLSLVFFATTIEKRWLKRSIVFLRAFLSCLPSMCA